jgi:hypothetical protein
MSNDGNVGGIRSKHCKIRLNHFDHWPLHIHIDNANIGCKLTQLPMPSNSQGCLSHHYFHYFGGYGTHCFDKAHLCVQANKGLHVAALVWSCVVEKYRNSSSKVFSDLFRSGNKWIEVLG